MLHSGLTGIAGTTPSHQKAHLWSLVLWATGIPHEIIQENGEWSLKVDPSIEMHARQQLTNYEEENANWPPPKDDEREKSSYLASGQPPTVFMMGCLVIIYSITGPWADGSPWFKEGAVMGTHILNKGEWWRIITGLTLHSNPVHLWGNVMIGGTITHFLCKTIGSGLGWFLIMLAGGLGNYINIYLHGSTHNSVGFSTAVFGAVGILSGLQSVAKRKISGALLLPLAAGFALLAMLGASGENTDLGAHLFGLLVGILIGVLTALYSIPVRLNSIRQFQFFLFLGSFLSVTICWIFAFNSS